MAQSYAENGHDSGEKIMPATIYTGKVTVELDEERGVVWVNVEEGFCIIRICQIDKKSVAQFSKSKSGVPNLDIIACREMNR